MKGWGVIAAALVLVGVASAAPEREQRTALRLTVFASGFAQPTHLAAPRSEPGKVYVVEQAGTIQVLVNGKRRGTFLDIRSRVRSGGERGLLSVAFHPGYARNHRFYVNYTDRNGATNVVEYRSNGVKALPGTARRLLYVKQPYENHNGGQVAFGLDGRLYVGMGDGGSAGDPENRAQDMKSRLGKLLSLNVVTKAVRIEALGLRNPWRFSFDREDGSLYIGDVGQSAIEEIDWLPRNSPRLENFGWDVREGTRSYESKPLGPGRYVPPVAQYSHSAGHCSVTGGFAYRGRQIAGFDGRYVYGDYCSGTIWSLKLSGGKASPSRVEPIEVPQLTSFGEDAAGELYAVSQGGTIYRLR